jgi:mannosyltransferase OCH1-like enzyme
MGATALMNEAGIDSRVALVADCPAARDLFEATGANSFMDCYHIANQLHMYGHFIPAARFYRMCHDISENKHMLHTQLLCEIKAGHRPSPSDMASLRALDSSFFDYIHGVEKLLQPGADLADVLATMGNSFESFHTGQEVDGFFLRAASHFFRRTLERFTAGQAPALPVVERIPRRLFLYWDRDPPAEVLANFDHLRALAHFDIQIYDHARAVDFLYSYFGRETRDIFLELRHPAAACDFWRVHALFAYGGYYLDADLQIADIAGVLHLFSGCREVYMVTHDYVVHNDFFGCVAESPTLAECISILTNNCYRFPELTIAMKTGPGVFQRALNRRYHRALRFCESPPDLHVFEEGIFQRVARVLDMPYRNDARNWVIYERNKG